jgi:hypothetical protein
MKATRFADEKRSEMNASSMGVLEPPSSPIEETALENFKHLCAAVVYDAVRGIADAREDEPFQRAWVLGQTDSRMSFDMCVEVIAIGTSFEVRAGLVEALRQRILGQPCEMVDAFARHLQSLALLGKPGVAAEAASSDSDLEALLGDAPPVPRASAPRPGRVC